MKLAIEGGKPVRRKPFPRGVMIGENEIKAVVKVLKSTYLTRITGQVNDRFEEEFAKFFGAKHAITTNSGTAALHVSYAALGLGPGDEVIVPPHTFLATATSVLHQNAVPIFTDINLNDFTIDPSRIEEAVTKRTKCIVPVHICGHPADMDSILKIAEEKSLHVVEDCAQAHTATYNGKTVGTLGDVAIFSFFEDKIMTTGEGGMILTNNDEVADKARLIMSHGERWAKNVGLMMYREAHVHLMLGFAFRMPEVEAAIGLAQLKRVKSFADKRIKNAEYLTRKLGKLDGITPPVVKQGCRHTFYKYITKFDPEKFTVNLDRFIDALRAEGIECDKRYPNPPPAHPLFRDKLGYGNTKCPFECPWYIEKGGHVEYKVGQCPNAEKVEKILFKLPMNPELTREDLDDVIDAVAKVSQAYSK